MAKQMSSHRQRIAVSAPPLPAMGIRGRIGVQINDALRGNHGNKQIHVKTQERLLIRAGESLPKIQMWAQASSAVMKQLGRQL